jgi:hypothetical protein
LAFLQLPKHFFPQSLKFNLNLNWAKSS